MTMTTPPSPGPSTPTPYPTDAADEAEAVRNADVDAGLEDAAEQPFAEGAQDALDADLRHRLISEAAFRRYAERNYEDGYELDDWLDAEAEVDHVRLGPGRG